MALPVLAAPIGPSPFQPIAGSNSIGTSLGVNIHSLRDMPGELDAIAATGVRYVRLDVGWDAVEKRPGFYDWSRIDPMVRAIAARGLQPLLILAYSNRNYEPVLGTAAGGAPVIRAPSDDAGRAAYARFAAAVAGRYSKFAPTLELWNEPNADRFWPPKADPNDYLMLAGQACAAIRRVVPQADVIAPGFGNVPRTPALGSPFLIAFGRSTLARCVSAVSVHPYLFMGALDAAPRWWAGLRATLGPAGGKPLFASETGVSTFGGHLDDLDQASYLVRMSAYDAALGIRGTIWYDWRDDGTDPNDPEAHFGLINADGQPKAAYNALQTLTRAVRPFPRSCLYGQGAGMRMLFFGSGRLRRILAWDIGPHGRTPALNGQAMVVTLPADAHLGAVSDVLGRPVQAATLGQQVRISGGQQPFYVDYTGSNPNGCDDFGA